MGGSASSRHLMEGWIDSITLKEHNINTFTNYFSGTCPDPDPYWDGHLQCVKYNARDTVKYWRTQLDNLIRYGPLAKALKSPYFFINYFTFFFGLINFYFMEPSKAPQTMFIQGWIHADLKQHILVKL